jgi:hypothetical protein
MWVKPQGNPVSRQEYEELLERIRKLEEALEAVQPKRGRPKKEELPNG